MFYKSMDWFLFDRNLHHEKVYSTDMTKKSTEVSLIPLFPSDHVKHTDPVLLFSTLST